MTGEWMVAEFDGDRQPIWAAGPFGEEHAREMFEYVVRRRSQRSDVVLRARSAALLRKGKVIEACGVRRSRRAPMLGRKRLQHLDVDSREAIAGLELLAFRIGRAALRVDGTPRYGPSWRAVRGAAVELLDLVRGGSSTGGVPGGGWWLIEWECGDCQSERERAALHDLCPYHEASPIAEPDYVDGA